MQFKNFELQASPHITRATCTDFKCGRDLIEVDNGWSSVALFCPKCENVYVLKLIKVPIKKIDEKFILECRGQVEELKFRADRALKRRK